MAAVTRLREHLIGRDRKPYSISDVIRMAIAAYYESEMPAMESKKPPARRRT
jgi:hypothetical protein